MTPGPASRSGSPRDTSRPDRIYLAVATRHGVYATSRAYWLGRPCLTCAGHESGPRVAPCRAPLTHATAALRAWREGSDHPERFVLLAPQAATLAEARRQAARMCPILTRPARRTTEPTN